MTQTAILAAVGFAVVVVASVVFLLIGRKTGRSSEIARQIEAKATAEETSKRILDDASRESESIRKTALLSGKEELIRLREEWEQEARKRREEIEREERRVQERESLLNRKYDLLEQRAKGSALAVADARAARKRWQAGSRSSTSSLPMSGAASSSSRDFPRRKPRPS